MDRTEYIKTMTDTLITLFGEDVGYAEDMLCKFGKTRFVDAKIDDGLDDGEDEYLMMRSFDVKVEGFDKPFYVRLYYGNNTYTFSTFTIS